MLLYRALCMVYAFKQFEVNAMTLALTCNHRLTCSFFRRFFFSVGVALAAVVLLRKRMNNDKNYVYDPLCRCGS